LSSVCLITQSDATCATGRFCVSIGGMNRHITIRVGPVLIVLCLAWAVVSAVAADKPKSQPAKTAKIKFTTSVDMPEGWDGKKHPAACVMGRKDELARMRRDLKAVLLKQHFAVVWMTVEKAKPVVPVSNKQVSKLVDGMLASRPMSQSKTGQFLLIASQKCGSAAIEILERHPYHLTGAVFISVLPVRRDEDELHQWRPSVKAWKVPMWVTVGTRPGNAAQLLVNWRQVAAETPKDASLTIDTQVGEGSGYIEPAGELASWLAAIAVGRKPKCVPDQQSIDERRVYRKFVAQMVAALKDAPPLKDGVEHTKRGGPVEIHFTAPAGWRRDEKGERKYNQSTSPYVQVYVTPMLRGPLFARACAAEWKSDGIALLDSYDKRLAKKGCLVIRYKQWRARGLGFEISSVLWPSRRKWHRWLVLSSAGAGSKDKPAVPMVLVLDASASPNVKVMAAAMKQMMSGATAKWHGGEKGK